MAHHANDHVPVGAAVAISGADLAELRNLLIPINEAALAVLEDRSSRDAPKTVVLSDAQFSELKELLLPGNEVARLLLAERDENLRREKNSEAQGSAPPDDPQPPPQD